MPVMCETCRFWRKTRNAWVHSGFCHRRAPSSAPSDAVQHGHDAETARWPLTRPLDWCGEHELTKETS